MSYVVGPKGQLVIEKRIRDHLGVQPGWRALQLLVDDHVEIHFVPPEHTRSLAGCLSAHVKQSLSTPEEFAAARATAWVEAAKQRASAEFAGEVE